LNYVYTSRFYTPVMYPILFSTGIIECSNYTFQALENMLYRKAKS